MRKHIADESIDLCYIDPPFNSKRNYNQIYNNIGTEDVAQAQAFVDTWTWNRTANEGFDEIVSNYNNLFTAQIYWTETGRPRYKLYANEYEGRLITNDWNDIKGLTSQAAEALGYPTQKPEALLERIIKASSNEGDTVLDAYCGCGTTIAVAERLQRNWIGVDITYQSISLILKRLNDAFGTDFTKELIDKDTQTVIKPASLELNGVPLPTTVEVLKKAERKVQEQKNKDLFEA